MLKIYIYLNILFVFGLVLYLFAINSLVSIKEIFYLFFSLFSVFIPTIFLLSDYEFANKEESGAYKLLFLGFVVYGFGNLLWYLNEIYPLNISLGVLNIFFLFQGFTKHFFLGYLAKTPDKNRYNQTFQTIFSLNMLVMLLSMFGAWSINLDNFFFDFYFIFESLFSILFIFYLIKESFSTHLDIKYFLFGQSIWLVSDCLYFLENYWDAYLIGNLSDFGYFVGFYLMLSSILFKNFIFTEKLDPFLEKNLKFS